MLNERDGRHEEPRDSINPYSSPQAPVQRGPFLIRLARALRRAAATYRDEIRRSEVTPLEHVLAWFSLIFFFAIGAVIAAIILWLLAENFWGMLSSSR